MTIEAALDAEYRDIPPWRSYELYTDGECLAELLANAQISEIDQDGGELDTYDLGNAPNEVIAEAEQVIQRAIEDNVFKHRGQFNELL